MSKKLNAAFSLDAYEADTVHLTAAQHGAFMLLLMSHWARKVLPVDPVRLARIARCTSADWKRSEPVILPLLRFDADGYHPAKDYFGPLPSFERVLDVSDAEWRALRLRVFERDGYACRYCGADDLPLECDHVFPVLLGGKSEMDNLAAACKPCNRSKGPRTVEVWRGH